MLLEGYWSIQISLQSFTAIFTSWAIRDSKEVSFLAFNNPVFDGLINHTSEPSGSLYCHSARHPRHRTVRKHLSLPSEHHLIDPASCAKLAYYLCFCFARSTRAVSIPAPVYCASTRLSWCRIPSWHPILSRRRCEFCSPLGLVH